MKKLLILLTLFAGLFNPVAGQRFKFQVPPELSTPIPSSAMTAYGNSPSWSAWVGNYTDISSNPTSWGDALKFKSLASYVKVAINHEYRRKLTAPYSYVITYNLSGYTCTDAAVPPVVVNDTLSIGFDPDSLTAYQDVMLKRYTGFLKMTLYVTGVYAVTFTTTTPSMPVLTLVPAGSLAPNFGLEIGFLSQPYYKKINGQSVYGFDASNAMISISNLSTPAEAAAQDFIALKWGVGSGLNPVTPANYELEWTYVDDYKVNAATGVIDQQNSNALKYDFNYNSTRVWLDTNYYRLPITYSRGFIVYRVRMVRPDSVQYKFPVYSQWTFPTNSGTIGAVPYNAVFAIGNAHMSDKLNWQYTVSFAEQGKYKHVMSYYDGLLKNRQSITRYNSQPNRLIATENVYDFEGRPAMTILPTPVSSPSFSLQDSLALNATTLKPYQAADFDTLQTSVCPGEITPTRLASSALASVYYSPLNPDRKGFQKFVPDAGGYPLVQTIFSPGYDKRVDKQGGAGDTLQIGRGHETKNDYVSAEQYADLNRMFGTDIGYAAFYNKTVTKDPNGQLSVAINDYEGRPVVSSLIGDGPDQSKHPVLTNEDVAAATSITEDILLGNTQNIAGNTRSLNRDFYMDFASNSTLQYIYNFQPYEVCPTRHLSVQAHYDYSVIDQCGRLDIRDTGTLGQTGLVPATPVSSPGAVKNVFLSQGSHTLDKTLTVSTDDIKTAVNAFFNDPGTCVKTEQQFIREETEPLVPCGEAEPTDCDRLTQQMMAQLWPRAKYGKYRQVGTNLVEATGNSSIFNLITPIEGSPWYRYQDDCVARRLPDSVYKDGTWYHNIRTMGVDTFIYIFNDTIARALLPLHPEYCQSLNCFNDTFKVRYEALPDAKLAGSMNLLSLNDVVARDPLVAVLSNIMPNAEDSLKTFRTGRVWLDSIALALAYCNCSDSIMFAECRNKIFNNQIDQADLMNDAVKAAYFKLLKPMYLTNRERLKAYLIAANANNNCAPCDRARMTLLPTPLVISWVTTSGGVDPNSPVYPGTTYGNTTSMDSLIYSMANFNEDSIDYYRNQADTGVSSMNYALTMIAIDSMLSQMNNCFTGSAALTQSQQAVFRTSMIAFYTNGSARNGEFTPMQVRAALDNAGVSINDLCNPYLANYDYLGAGDPTGATKECRTDQYYEGARDFLNAGSVITALTSASGSPVATLMTLSGANPFESELIARLGTGTNINVAAAYTAASHLYKLYLTPGIAGGDSVVIYLRGNGTGTYYVCNGIFNNLTGSDYASVSSVKCIRDMSGFNADGYIGNFAFLVEVERHQGSTITHCNLLGWDDAAPEMAGTNQSDIAQCIPCTQMRKLYTQFADTLAAYGIKGIDHPYYKTMLRNFMNYEVGKMFTVDNYERMIKGCALADELEINNYIGYVQTTFSNDNYADAFLSSVVSNSSTAGIYVLPTLRYREAGGQVTMLFDLNNVPKNKLYAVTSYINNYTSGVVTKAVNARFNPTGNLDFMGWLVVDNNAPFDPTVPTTMPVWPTTAINNGYTVGASSMTASILMGASTANGYVPHRFYPVYKRSGASNAEISLAAHDLENYLYALFIPGQFLSSRAHTVGSDYNLPEKKAYLTYAWGQMPYPTSQNLDSLKASNLQATIFPTNDPTYVDGSNPGDISNLYLSQTNASITHGFDVTADILTIAKNYLGGNRLFFTSGSQVRTINANLKAMRCSDGTFWYRYYGAGDTLWNVFIKLPAYIPHGDIENYEAAATALGTGGGGLYPALGNGPSRHFRVELRHRITAQPLLLDAYTDYVLGDNLVLKDVMLSMPGSNIPSTTNTILADTVDNCERRQLQGAIVTGKMRYYLYMDSVRTAVYNAFYAHVMGQVGEQLFKGCADQKFNYTLYYYDRAGNLMRTIPPAGVKKMLNTQMAAIDQSRSANGAAIVPAHLKATENYYNSLNEVVKSKTPDGGEVNNYYDNAGRLIFSQNDKQKAVGNLTYSLYDGQGRSIETGQAKLACPWFADLPFFADAGHTTPNVPPDCGFRDDTLGLWSPYPAFIRRLTAYTHEDIINLVHGYPREDVVMTVYDDTCIKLSDYGLPNQENLRKRIATLKFFTYLGAGKSGYTGYSHATHYSYDPEGNIQTLVQDMPGLESSSQRFKRIDYDYDVISGKVNMLSYNRGNADQYYHRYQYDDDNRITRVETSNDGLIWNRDASYQYYQHGPLARMVEGDQRVQGIDYAYTIQGWLKAINGDVLNSSLDMGLDGVAKSTMANDAAGTTLDYFRGDYRPIGDTAVTHLAAQSRGLYNGNIARQTTEIIPFQTLTANYQYDQLNRLKTADYASVDPANVAMTANIPLANVTSYKSSYSFDADGNITKLARYGLAPNTGTPAAKIDDFTYTYNTVSGVGQTDNKLLNVTDAAANTGGNDLPQYTSNSIRFEYDALGNTVKDRTSNQDLITWNLYGKATQMKNNAARSSLDFGYDAQGNRVSKIARTTTDTSVAELNEYYVREASGNILAVYNQENKYRMVENTPVLTTAPLVVLKGKQSVLDDFIFPGFGDDPVFQQRMDAFVNAQGTSITEPVSYYLNEDATMSRMLDAGNGYMGPLAAWEAANNKPVMGEALQRGIDKGNPTILRGMGREMMTSGDRLVNDFIANSVFAVDENMGNELCANFRIEEERVEDRIRVLKELLDYGKADDEELANNALIRMNGLYPSSMQRWMDTLAKNEVMRAHAGGLNNTIAYGLDIYGNDTTLKDFFDSWSDGEATLKAVTGMGELAQVAYRDDPKAYLSAMIDKRGTGFLDTAIGLGESLDQGAFAMKIIKLLGAGTLEASIDQPSLWMQTIRSRRYWLAEHHLYGSSRLGIKKYWSSLYYNDYNFSQPNNIGVPLYDTTRLQGKQPWFSGETNEMITPAGMNGWADYQTAPMFAQHSLGLKQYEQTNHLGNVLATVSDKRAEQRGTGSDDSIRFYHPSVVSASDYYPFGMLMPGRFTSDAGSQCMNITQTTLVPAWVVDDMVPPVTTNTKGTATLTLLANKMTITTREPGDGVEWEQAAEVSEANTQLFNVESVEGGAMRVSISEMGVNEDDPEGEPVALERGSLMIDKAGLYELSYRSTSGTVSLNLSQAGGSGAMLRVIPLKRKLIYETKTSIVRVCNDVDGYRFGFNGQMKVNEIAGVGNWNTAEYWEYNTRTADELILTLLKTRLKVHTPHSAITQFGKVTYWVMWSQYIQMIRAGL